MPALNATTAVGLHMALRFNKCDHRERNSQSIEKMRVDKYSTSFRPSPPFTEAKTKKLNALTSTLLVT